MKQKLPAIIILLLCSLSSFSQAYVPFLENSSWTILIADFGGNEYRTYYQGDDITFSGNIYHKYIGQTNEQHLLREDVLAKKVYKLINGSDVLLYDFSLQVSDNITLDNGQSYEVQYITNVNVNGGQRREFYLRNLDPFWSDEVWIEGVGRPTHPLLAMSEFFSDPSFFLICSFQNAINVFNYGIVYGGTPTNCSLGVEEFDGLSNKITFAPNPFDKELMIRNPQGFHNSTVKVFNSIGQKVREINSINGAVFTLQRDDLNNGLYLIQLSENGRELTVKKLIVN